MLHTIQYLQYNKMQSQRLVHRVKKNNVIGKCLYSLLSPAFTAPEQSQSTNRKNIIYLKKEDTILSNYMLKVKSHKLRQRNGLIALEGKRLIKDAIVAGISPLAVFFSQKEDLEYLNITDENVKLYKSPYKDLKLWSNLTTAPGIMAFIRLSDSILMRPDYEYSLPVTIICDQVRDPGNLGSIIRSSAAAGVKKIIFMKGCVDPWDLKVLRGGSGGHFRVPLVTELTWNEIHNHITRENSVFLADCYESKSDRRESIPVLDFDRLKIELGSDIVLVVGGEVTGLSREALELASSNPTYRIHIQLENQVDSLNSAISLSVIMFEIRRQLKNFSQNIT